MKKSRVTIIICSIFLISQSFGLKPSREYRITPEAYNLIYKEVNFMTPDSLDLYGWFFPAQLSEMQFSKSNIGKYLEYEVIDCQPRPTMIICDGDAGNMDGNIIYAANLSRKGFNVLLFDWRGFGHSSDWETDTSYMCYTEYLTDYNAAIDFVKTMPEVDPARIGLLGYSTGAYLSFSMLSLRNDINAFIGRGLLMSFRDVLKILNEINSNDTYIFPKDYPRGTLPVNSASSINIPVLLIVGEDDNKTPVWMSQKIYNELAGPKELWIVNNARHGGSNSPIHVQYKEYFNRVVNFLKQHLTN